jgi:hypothetical protein
MSERYGKPPESSMVAATIEAAVNLLSVIFAQVYYPCHSNGLKEIAKHLGFRWSASIATGTGTIVWRQEWESSRAPASKEAILIYNAEDCQALEVVSNCLLELRRVSSRIGDSPSGDVVNTAQLKWEHPYGFKRNTFAFPELDVINKRGLLGLPARAGLCEVQQKLEPRSQAKCEIHEGLVPQHDSRVCQTALLSEVQLATLLQAHKIQ